MVELWQILVMNWGCEVEVEIEVVGGSRIKRRPDGRVHYISPWSCPFDYGSVPGTLAADGDPQDALVLGASGTVGQRVRGRLVGVVPVVDDGVCDDKWVVRPPGAALDAEVRDAVARFFMRYRQGKNALAMVRRRSGVVVQAIRWMPGV